MRFRAENERSALALLTGIVKTARTREKMSGKAAYIELSSM